MHFEVASRSRKLSESKKTTTFSLGTALNSQREARRRLAQPEQISETMDPISKQEMSQSSRENFLPALCAPAKPVGLLHRAKAQLRRRRRARSTSFHTVAHHRRAPSSPPSRSGWRPVVREGGVGALPRENVGPAASQIL